MNASNEEILAYLAIEDAALKGTATKSFDNNAPG
jgi:hypothetical protein